MLDLLPVGPWDALQFLFGCIIKTAMYGLSVAGADGCRDGWAVVKETHSGALSWQVIPSLEALFDSPNAPAILAIDIPIGLPERGARACDIAARALLGPRKASSVFPAPIRPLFSASSYAEACDIRYAAEGKRLSKQAWAIVPKIRDVDNFLRSDPIARARIREVHPEVCFYFMAGGRSMSAGKKTRTGRAERLILLTAAFGPAVDVALKEHGRIGCAADDLLDAFAGLWTARRVRDGLARTIPSIPPRDACGLPMEMVA